MGTQTHNEQLPTADLVSGAQPTGVDSLPGAGKDPGADAMPPVQLDRYRITARLGAGAFGVVYQAFDEELKRYVAIKVPHRHRLTAPEDFAIYLAEARALASLDHPGIVPVYDVDRTEDGTWFVVSKFIEGSDLRTRMAQARPARAESARIVACVAEALHHAHQRRLVHRDIKPANILLDATDNPIVADFGLALHEEDFGKGPSAAGTPGYMSPEQARGEGHRVDARSDVYSLGVVLYELLTGQRPFVGSRQSDILEQIRLQEPRPPRQLDDSIPRELDRICLKALAKRASDRYSTALDLAEDLRHWLASAENQPASPASVDQAGKQPLAPAAPQAAMVTFVSDTERRPIRIIPKGLRSFDAEDADFFLELLPGPRDRDRLPDSIRLWKKRIEETDPDKTFAVGLLYGPSGCGKSSLIKAGLLPRLAGHVMPVYIEAAPDATEQRLGHALHRRCPELAADLDLVKTLALLRREKRLLGGKKVLLVLDQFEQWLHARREAQTSVLIQALRQCDGEHVQALILVRDDFWMATTRFLRELEVPLLEGQNSAAVDLFDLRHASKVLAAYGRAFGALPEGPLTSEQEQFVERAVAGLAQEDKVISVRLSLFAEMVKGKPWLPATLTKLGGAEGVGVAFLEETFSVRSAAPKHRLHQKAARAVLRSLLPETGVDIKGHQRSYLELLEASGYEQRPREFEDLLRILDAELRLVTPSDPEREIRDSDAPAAASAAPASAPDGLPYYQLTHDYLVPALRQWLSGKQKETWRGRAELRLEERTAQWLPGRQRRWLPALPEFLLMWFGVPRTQQKPEQRALLRAAARHHALSWGLGLTAFLAVALFVQQYIAALHRSTALQRAETLVEWVLNASPADVPEAIRSLEPVRELALPLLARAPFDESPAGAIRQLHAALALTALGDAREEFLIQQIGSAPSSEARNIIGALLLAREPACELLRKRLGEEKNPEFKARYAITLLHLGDAGGADQVLRLSANPTQRTAFIHAFKDWHGGLKGLPDMLQREGAPGYRSGLCAALGLLDPNSFAVDERRALENMLGRLFRTAPDGGTHSAAGYALRQWRRPLPALPASSEPVAGRDWFVNRHQMTMLKIQPGAFLMGDSGLPGATPRTVRVERPYFICDREVWVDLFQQFLHDPEYPVSEKAVLWKLRREVSPTDDCPVSEVSWYDAILFCNWLSYREGRQPRYTRVRKAMPSNDDQRGDIWRQDLSANGYRLPAEVEWEYACRAGSATAFFFGDDPDLLTSYAFLSVNSKTHTWPGASKLPNDWGLFDMYGNVSEWCWDKDVPANPQTRGAPSDSDKGQMRVERGGSYFSFEPRYVRSGARAIVSSPEQRMQTKGFRVVCGAADNQ